ncbi:uncharacterized protein si:dkeyp-117h8.4 isoform X2 [Dicentrarchus labrax]|uniref:uncharacterized protein si:dkeyp-117h8.4 isoform X2 n=1 Tax=Dicentrarchus labrax TaxID=13489 RepID=UPI0021F59EDC|nr:uncharacterized protein si:dkeyp-117h8.4 isoform X2 [Dicentrarchus labrax]
MCTMDLNFDKQMRDNSLIYKMSLDRIIEKYSKLQYQDGAIEVDLDNTNTRTIENYMKLSKTELNKLESKSLTDLRDESLRSQDITGHYQDGGADETCVSSISSSHISMHDDDDDDDDDGLATSDTTQLTVSSLDESQRNLSATELQPEDQDEELEMSLGSRSGSWVELYPSMISRIERAWHRQHVSEAADSVLRRYRRWRQHPNRSYLNNTFTVTLRHGNPKKMLSETLLRETSNSPVKMQFMRTEATPRSPLQMVTMNPQDWQAQQQSPGRGRGSLRREQHQPVLAMDLSGCSETTKPKEISLNETFNVSQLGEQPSTYTVSPSRPFYPTAKAPLDVSLRCKRLSLAAHSPQTDGSKERPDVNGSPVRQSPLKARMISGLCRSPHVFSRSPKAHSVENLSREFRRPRSMSTSLSSPPQRPTVPLRMLDPHDFHHSFQSQPHSPQSATAAEGRHRLRRHLSFDSSLPSFHVSYSPKKLDEDFIKLYHKFVCQNKSSFFNGAPCRYCARSSEASRGHSSTALAALALSPHRSLLRKRHRELGWDSHPQSKRSRDEYCTSRPGSISHGNEMLRRRLCQSEYEQSHGGLSYSPSKYSMLQRFSTEQRSTDAHQETWMSQGRRLSATEFSGLGGSFERKMTDGFSPRKWC